MNSEFFADSQGWIALLNRSDQYHVAACEVMGEFGRARRRIVTTDWVLAETVNGLARTNARREYVEAVRRMQVSANVLIIRIDHESFEQALETFSRAGDKGWGLVDCASFAVMNARGVTEAFTSDHLFEEAGFRRLL